MFSQNNICRSLLVKYHPYKLMVFPLEHCPVAMIDSIYFSVVVMLLPLYVSSFPYISFSSPY